MKGICIMDNCYCFKGFAGVKCDLTDNKNI